MIYVGYDPREKLAYDVCVHSIRKHSPHLEVKRLYSADIKEYNRNFNEPQSTDFTFTRFLVPYLSNYQGYSLFCDCDFLFLSDLRELNSYLSRDKAVWVVKHPRYAPNSEIKMDNIPQNSYERKNWTSLMLFNNSHPMLKVLEPHFINNTPNGKDLHQFAWIPDECIGELPLEWNCLDGYYYLENPKAIHYTDGGPWFEGYEKTRYSDVWLQYQKEMLDES